MGGIRLNSQGGRSEPSRKINIISTAAMHTLTSEMGQSPHYRATALLSAFAPISRPWQNGFNATLW